jgi:group II intron reverse transcriptase/maturase
VADGRVLELIRSFLEAGCIAAGKRLPTEEGTPQGGVVSPLLSNILLTPFDREMRRRGYHVTRYADDWIATCRSKREAEAVLRAARKILAALGVELHPGKTRIVHVRHGFEFLGYKIKRGERRLRLPPRKIRSGVRHGALYAFPRSRSIDHFKEQIRKRTRRKAPVSTEMLIEQINPVIRGWGQYFCKAHVRKLFAQLDRWILQRIWSHRLKRWRCRGYRVLPERRLYGELGLVRLVALIPSLAPRFERGLAKAGCGKSARPVWEADGGQRSGN